MWGRAVAPRRDFYRYGVVMMLAGPLLALLAALSPDWGMTGGLTAFALALALSLTGAWWRYRHCPRCRPTAGGDDDPESKP